LAGGDGEDNVGRDGAPLLPLCVLWRVRDVALFCANAVCVAFTSLHSTDAFGRQPCRHDAARCVQRADVSGPARNQR
jgi:hypothetical protein